MSIKLIFGFSFRKKNLYMFIIDTFRIYIRIVIMLGN